MMRTRFFAALFLSCGIAAACSSTKTEPRECTPGNYVFCRCADRSEGTKLCKESGMGFEPCEPCVGGEADFDAGVDPVFVIEAGSKDQDVTGVPRPGQGEVLITEVMYDPSGAEPDQEWFELFNKSGSIRLLSGLTIRDGGGRSLTIPAEPPLTIAANAYIVFVRSTAASVAAHVPKEVIAYDYGNGALPTQGILLNNGVGGAISLLDGTTVVTQANYGGWITQASPGGASLQLKTLTHAASLTSSNWCISSIAWAPRSDLGTPGKARDCL
jgi:hypothetical protein